MEHKSNSLEDHSLIDRLKSPHAEERTEVSINNEGEETLSGKSSPDSGCAICLGRLENKSFTDSCFHTFCFTCLLEWSKVKAECPLCKQPFKSIVHNVRSIEDYDQYYINVRATENSWQSPDGRRFRYPSTLTAERRRHRAFEETIEYNSHRLTYAPHTFPTNRARDLGTDHPSTSNFRRHIYENALWIQQDENLQRRYRDTSPEFFCQNPACTHRLIPWLNRELIALLHDSESQVIFVLELILALIMRYDIKSPEFYVHIEPYLQTRTTHFIHEFYNFARSPYDITVYDRRAVYEQLETCTNHEIQSSVSSTTSDIIVLPSQNQSDDGLSSKPDSTSTYQTRKQLKQLSVQNEFENSQHSSIQSNADSVTKHIIWNSDESWIDGRDLSQSALYASPCSSQDLESGLPGPSSSTHHLANEDISLKRKREKSSDNDGDSDCMIIGYVKPRSERTPELIDLVSNSSDDDEAEKSNIVCRIKKSLLTEVDDKSFVKKKVRRFDRNKFYAWKTSQCANESSSRIEKHHKVKYSPWSPSDSSTKHSKHSSGEFSKSKDKTSKLGKKRSRKQSGDQSHASSADTLISDSAEESTGTDYSGESTLRICRVVGKSSTVKFYKILSENSSSGSRKKHKRQKKKKHRKHKHHHKHRHHSSSSERI